MLGSLGVVRHCASHLILLLCYCCCCYHYAYFARQKNIKKLFLAHFLQSFIIKKNNASHKQLAFDINRIFTTRGNRSSAVKITWFNAYKFLSRFMQDRPNVFAALLQLQRRLGKDQFPLIEQHFYPSATEIVSKIQNFLCLLQFFIIYFIISCFYSLKIQTISSWMSSLRH